MTQEILHGDCLDLMTQISDKTINLIITSPPYFNAKKYSSWPDYTSYLNWCQIWINECFRILQDGRMLCINTSSVIEARVGRQFRSKRYNIPADIYSLCKNFWFCEEIIWEKPEGAAINRNQRFSLDRHPLQWRANPTTERILVMQKPINCLNDKIIKSNQPHRIEGKFDRGEVWKINPVTKSQHPAPFPLDIPEKLINYYSWPNDIVFDLFAGSGTTLVAAKNLNRQFIGIEKEKEYYDICVERLK